MSTGVTVLIIAIVVIAIVVVIALVSRSRKSRSRTWVCPISAPSPPTGWTSSTPPPHTPSRPRTMRPPTSRRATRRRPTPPRPSAAPDSLSGPAARSSAARSSAARSSAARSGRQPGSALCRTPAGVTMTDVTSRDRARLRRSPPPGRRRRSRRRPASRRPSFVCNGWPATPPSRLRYATASWPSTSNAAPSPATVRPPAGCSPARAGRRPPEQRGVPDPCRGWPST